jgi:hypothetical protein
LKASSLQPKQRTSQVFLMSAEGDNYATGTPDLVEHTRANPSSARSRGGVPQYPSRANRTEPNTITNRGRGTNGRTNSRMKNGPKDEHQV